jgi:hypothetical protein
MKLWTIWIRADDGGTWLHSAWDDDSTAESHDAYEADVDKAKESATANAGAMRVLAVEVPDGAIYGAFKVPETQGRVLPEETPDHG